jgi:hypothetical protein
MSVQFLKPDPVDLHETRLAIRQAWVKALPQDPDPTQGKPRSFRLNLLLLEKIHQKEKEKI